MYISYKHKVIFVHCRKAAGSSISCYLSKVGGPRDIQLSAIAETLELGTLPPLRTLYASVSNLTACKALAKSLAAGTGLRNAIANGAKGSFRKRLGAKPQHASAQLLKEKFPTEWQNFNSFCVVRNSYDMAVSDYFWRTRSMDSPPSFYYYLCALKGKDSLGGVVPVGNYYNWPRYTTGGHVVVENVIRFENLIEDIGVFFSRVQVPFHGLLPRLKSTHRPKGAQLSDLNDFYDVKALKLVQELYEEEIEHFEFTVK